ncbi:MAG: HD domain-containing protein, partial [Planctomycetales bacterium]|nr:HD domain-containing protein [Planctomycetales bacterium]
RRKRRRPPERGQRPAAAAALTGRSDGRVMAITYGPRFEDALLHAARLHKDQVRKESGVPYVTHLLAVASLVGEAGGGEDEVIAALLHDAAEDQGGRETLAEIRKRFGPRVADIVEACSDTFETPKPPWRARKEAYLAHLPHASASTLLVSCADKVHNSRATLSDLRENGEKTWARFKGGKDGTLWYFRSLVETFRKLPAAPRRLVEELARTVEEMGRLAGRTGK